MHWTNEKLLSSPTEPLFKWSIKSQGRSHGSLHLPGSILTDSCLYLFNYWRWQRDDQSPERLMQMQVTWEKRPEAGRSSSRQAALRRILSAEKCKGNEREVLQQVWAHAGGSQQWGSLNHCSLLLFPLVCCWRARVVLVWCVCVYGCVQECELCWTVSYSASWPSADAHSLVASVFVEASKELKRLNRPAWPWHWCLSTERQWEAGILYVLKLSVGCTWLRVPSTNMQRTVDLTCFFRGELGSRA